MRRYLVVVLLLLCGSVVKAANFPSSISTDSNLYVAVNNCYTTMTNAINISTPVITAANTASFPSAGTFIIENEVIKYAAKTSNSFTGCTRGFDGTAPAAHTAGKLIYASIIAAHHNVLKDEIKAIEDYVIGSGTDIHVDTTTHRVGIGTVSPAQALDVVGSVQASGVVGGASGSFSGEVAAGTLNTGAGGSELWPMDQSVTTTSSPTFAQVSAGAFIGDGSGLTGLPSGGDLIYPSTDTPSFPQGLSSTVGGFSGQVTSNSQNLIDYYEYVASILAPTDWAIAQGYIFSPFRSFDYTISTITVRAVDGSGDMVIGIEQRPQSDIMSTGTAIWTGNVTVSTTSFSGGTSSDFTVPSGSALFVVPVSSGAAITNMIISYTITKD